MNTAHISGFPRIGAKRELKLALESFWQGKNTETDVQQVAKTIRQQNWAAQQAAGLDFVAVGDFSFYDHVLDTLLLVGAAPERFGFDVQNINLTQYSQLARGNQDEPALEMTKWFDTNYHYLVPEWHQNTSFSAQSHQLITQIQEAQGLGHDVKPTLIGPLSLLYLGKCKGGDFDRLSLLPRLLPVYQQLLREIALHNVSWLQLDEPILTLDLPDEWIAAFKTTYQELSVTPPKLILGTYFGDISQHAKLLANLPIHGIHIDAVRAPKQLAVFQQEWPSHKVLSVGIVDGRNIWRSHLSQLLASLTPLKEQFGTNLWIASSCSLLHSPQDLDIEDKLDTEIKSWLAFANQKLVELGHLKQALQHGVAAVQAAFDDSDQAANNRANSARIHKPSVNLRLANLHEHADQRQSPYEVRIKAQQEWLKLPILPTTTIGSFPQTTKIRQARAAFKTGMLNQTDYEKAMQTEIALVVKKQEDLGLDVLVHGEAERNDMVEYFGEQLDGYCFTQFGWVQSYGSRCVKPPIIFGDISRPKPMTVAWSAYAQSLTKRPMKGMLTGPVTILQWSFVRDDVSRETVAKQIALALNDEVLDLENAGIKIIQIDEPAYREGLPLKKADWNGYLNWASQAFRLSHANVKDSTQIHTHMCYSEFNDILPAIVAMDADVITIETSRSDMDLLTAFGEFNYPNDIGPGVYDIHSPRIPKDSEIENLLQKAIKVIPAERLWVNPDCGLKTRGWVEVEAALATMLAVTQKLRKQLSA